MNGCNSGRWVSCTETSKWLFSSARTQLCTFVLSWSVLSTYEKMSRTPFVFPRSLARSFLPSPLRLYLPPVSPSSSAYVPSPARLLKFSSSSVHVSPSAFAGVILVPVVYWHLVVLSTTSSSEDGHRPVRLVLELNSLVGCSAARRPS